MAIGILRTAFTRLVGLTASVFALNVLAQASFTRPDTSFGINGSIDLTLSLPATRQVEARVVRRTPEVIYRYGFTDGDQNQPLLRAVAADGTVRTPAPAKFVDQRPPRDSDRVPCPTVGLTFQYCVVVGVSSTARLLAGATQNCTGKLCEPVVSYILEKGGAARFIASSYINVGVPTASLGPGDEVYIGGRLQFIGPSALQRYSASGALIGTLALTDDEARAFRLETTSNSALFLLTETGGKITRLTVPHSSFADRTTWRTQQLLDVSAITTGKLTPYFDRPGGRPLFVRTDTQLIKVTVDGRADSSYGQNGVVDISDASWPQFAFYALFNERTGEVAAPGFVVSRLGVRRNIDAPQLINQPYRQSVAHNLTSVAKDGIGNLSLSVCGRFRNLGQHASVR